MVLDEPLSFWGGFDPATGTVIDQAHPQAGESITAKIVAMASSRGSAGSPGALAESLRLGTGPAAIVLGQADINVAVAALVVEELYQRSCPVVEIPPASLRVLESGGRVSIDENGTVTVHATASTTD